MLVLVAGNPDSARAFSGSARHLCAAIEAAGMLHAKANVLGWTDPFHRGTLPMRLLRRLDRFGVEDAYRWSDWCFARNTARALRTAAQHPGFDACLMYGTTFLPRLNRPTYCYFDATVAQVAGGAGWEFAGFSPQTVARLHAYQGRVFAQCAAVTPRTQWAADSVIADYGVPPGKVTPVGAGANYLGTPPEHGPYDTRTILFVGSEWARKGGPLLLEAFRRVRARVPGARLRIVGSAPPVAEPGVEVVGRIDKDAPGGLERLLAEYAQASVFCMMSTFEPFGIVVLEAQQCGVPCVLPDAFAFPEMVRHGETGSLVPPGDAEALADALCELLGDPTRLAAMGAAARRWVAERWTWAHAAARLRARIEADLQAVGKDAAN